MKITVRELPDFHPNEWMFTKHNHCENHREDLERWEIYAWAVRDAMIRAGGMNQEKFLMRQKIVYDKYMMGNDKNAILPPRMHVLNNWIMQAKRNLEQKKFTLHLKRENTMGVGEKLKAQQRVRKTKASDGEIDEGELFGMADLKLKHSNSVI